jgi:hypothetical protein
MFAQLDRIRPLLSPRVQNRVDEMLDVVDIMTEMKNPKVLRSMAPSALRGLVLKSGKRSDVSEMQANHKAHFNWTYPHDHPEMHELYERAKLGQWNGSSLPWSTSVDPLDKNVVRIAPLDMIDLKVAAKLGISIKPSEHPKMMHDLSSWMLSQFLHGEQGALLAAAQVTESVQFFDGKLYGSTQVMDEGRHVEVFHRYLSEKLGKMYAINDNLFVIIDALMTDTRWDMKFLGMQIMVEGVALGAFSFLYQSTQSLCSRNCSNMSFRTRRAMCITVCWRSRSTLPKTSVPRSATSVKTGPTKWPCSCATASWPMRCMTTGTAAPA